MLISPKYQFIFFKPLKCASSSIEKSLLQNCSSEALCTGGYNHIDGEIEYVQRNNYYIDAHTGEDVMRFHPHTIPDHFLRSIKNPGLYSDYKKITSIRNPWDLVFSFYRWVMSDALKFKKEWSQSIAGQSLIINESDTVEQAKLKFNRWLLTKTHYPTYRSKNEFNFG